MVIIYSLDISEIKLYTYSLLTNIYNIYICNSIELTSKYEKDIEKTNKIFCSLRQALEEIRIRIG